MAGDEHDFEGRSRAAQAKAAHALDRLLKLAETRDSGQIRRVARFIAALYNGDAYPLDLFELRAVDVAISDDVINCIDALRWGRADLYKLVPDGQKRIEAVIRDWGVAPPEPLVEGWPRFRKVPPKSDLSRCHSMVSWHRKSSPTGP